MSSLFDLSNDVAVVVGGTGSLGSSIAIGLAAHGAQVAIVGRNADRGQHYVDQIAASGGSATFVAADALDLAALELARTTITNTLGQPTVLINAAGGNRPEATLAPGGEFTDLTMDGLRAVLDLNLAAGVWLPTQVFAPPMLTAGRGSIINVASMAGITPLSRVPGYSAAKAAVISLTRFLAREWATRGVRVNAISPGFFPADQNRQLLFTDEGGYTPRGQQIIAHTPMARFGEARELQGAAVWLASEPASSFVTGANIIVDGGFTATTI